MGTIGTGARNSCFRRKNVDATRTGAQLFGSTCGTPPARVHRDHRVWRAWRLETKVVTGQRKPEAATEGVHYISPPNLKKWNFSVLVPMPILFLFEQNNFQDFAAGRVVITAQ